MYNYDDVESLRSKNGSPMIYYQKDAKKGTKFTVMVIGELGTGKTTFLNCLLDKKVKGHRYEVWEGVEAETKTIAYASAKNVGLPNLAIVNSEFRPETAQEEPGIGLTETHVEIADEEGVQKIHLNIIDAPGYGENLDNEVCFTEIENYLKQQFDIVLSEETRIKRNPRFSDARVHVLLYFITPTGHGLKEIDVACMKRLAKYVNIIPVISKADSFTENELKHFKRQIMFEIEKFNIPVFQFDNGLEEYNQEEDYDLIQHSKYLASIQPFAVTASEQEFELTDEYTGKSKVVKGRRYPWGIVDVENPRTSDFSILKSVLLDTHLQDLKDLTHDFLYETYRSERLMNVAGQMNHPEGDDENEFDNGRQESVTLPKRENDTIPSLSNLAKLTGASADSSFELAGHLRGNKEEDFLSKREGETRETGDETSARLTRGSLSTRSSSSSVSNDTHNQTRKPSAANNSFKRISIAPQRNQLRQLSETVPYVIKHERLLERQQKLEEMEMMSAKELADRAALLEKKAAELKERERNFLRRSIPDRLELQSFSNGSYFESSRNNSQVPDSETSTLNSTFKQGEIKKEETLTDLHSIVSNR